MSKTNYIKSWRSKISKKIGRDINQKQAAKLLDFKCLTTISKMERELMPIQEKTIFFAEGILNLPAEEIIQKLDKKPKSKR